MKKGDRINFNIVNAQSLNIARLMQSNRKKLIRILTRYETYKTAEDEIERSLDLLTHLDENKSYFKAVVGPIAAFMPSNQPLYSLACFAIIPALMSEKVYVKSPETMVGFYDDMLDVLKIKEQPFSIEHMKISRSECVDFFATTKFNPETNSEQPTFEAIIFTGTSKNADLLRKRFHKSVLFIANGSGHNPLVVTESADIEKAIDGIMSVRSYNQGQDCASPNAILVHSKVYEDVLHNLRKAVRNLKVGPYNSPTTDIGPISRPDTLLLVKEFLRKNQEYIDKTTDGVIRVRSNVVEPTIIAKPLCDGPNFEEVFAPIFILQRYDTDEDLRLYFQDKQYANNAMYITIFGKSELIEKFVTRDKVGKALHDRSTIIYNNDLHKPGIERGVLPYGGYGRGASCVSKDGNIISKPTLPQREIYEYLVQGKSIEGFKDRYNDKITKQQTSANKSLSKSDNITLDDLMKLYSPEILKWTCLRKSPEELLNLSVGKNIFMYYDEFDSVLGALRNGTLNNLDAFFVNLLGIKLDSELPISFRQLLGLAQSVHWDREKLNILLKYNGFEYSTESINERLPRVKYWLENYNKNQIISLQKKRNEKYFQSMSEEDLLSVKKFRNYLLTSIDEKVGLDDINANLYSFSKSESLSKKENAEKQKKFFKNLYNLLIGSDNGPKLSTFIWAGDQKTIVKLLDTEGLYDSESNRTEN